MGAAGIDDEESIRCSRHPDAVLLLPFCIDAYGVIGWRADAKNAGRFENRARQEEPHEHQEERRECAGDGCPHDAAAHLVNRRIRTRFHDGGRGRGFCRRRCAWLRRSYTGGRQLIGLTIQVQTSVEINSELPGVRTSAGTLRLYLQRASYTTSPTGIPLCTVKRIISLNMKSAAPNKTKYNMVGGVIYT